VNVERLTGDLLEGLVRAAKVPGVQYVVVDDAGAVFEYAGGSADLAAGRAMTSATSMMAYSMSKTVTAAAVLQLADAKRLALDDPIDKYVESPYGPGITVRELLSHTSGIPNPIPLRWVHPAAQHATFDERAALADVLRRHSKLSSAPGTKYAYSNIGYWLLGSLVEHVSGEPFTAYVASHVFRVLGVEQELAYEIRNPADHAGGYLEKFSLMNLVKGWLIDSALVGGYEGGRWLRIADHYPNGPAFGGIVGTARGFAAFLQDQLRPHSRLFGDATRSLFYEPQRTRDGRSIAMTPGWHVGSVNGDRFFYKEGGGGGFHCMMRLYPATRLAAVVMTNATGFDVRRLMDTIDPKLQPVS